MKLLLTLLPALLTQTTGRRNQRIVIGFLLFTTVLVALFSIVFHQIMAYEGRDYSYITGVYWTLTVMSTLGFGDITFTSDIGKLFSIIVLVSGIILIMIVMRLRSSVSCTSRGSRNTTTSASRAPCRSTPAATRFWWATTTSR